MDKPKIIFRADAGTDIGYGHFIRSLALADMLNHDFHCIFATQEPTEYQRSEVLQVCDELIELPADSSRFTQFLELLNGDEIVVLDNYFYDTDYQRAIKNKGCKLVCVDDMHDKHYVADVVINHGLTDPGLFDTEPYTRLCLGLKWALLRKPFLDAKPVAQREKGHYVVSFGGSDWNNLTLQVTNILQESNKVNRISVIIGDKYENPETLQQFPKASVLKNLSAQKIVDLFSQAECAILPSSTIAIEAIACGCPVAAGYYADNQKEFYDVLRACKQITPLGDYMAADFSIPANINITTTDITFKSDIRKRFTDLLKKLC